MSKPLDNLSNNLDLIIRIYNQDKIQLGIINQG